MNANTQDKALNYNKGEISMLTNFINPLFYFYYLLIIIRIFLSWIPNTDWNSQPFAFLSSITDPVLNIFRGIIPPIGGMLDISPVFAIILLQLIQVLVVNMLLRFGL